jgi:glutamate synthase (NADPH/NADH) small chain
MPGRTGFLEYERRTASRRPVDERVRDYREVYMPLPVHVAREQASRCMDCGVAFCHHGCPLGNLIPEWNDLVGRDEWGGAIQRLHATNNFPEFTGRLCPAPCEPACVLAINDDPVTIEQIEKAIIERAFDEGWVRAEPPAHRTGKRVAVVGSGPAGLAAAAQLNRAGHLVTVYEKADRVGGLLRYGIPDFKMEKWVIDRRLDLLEAEGIIFETGYTVGVDIAAATLREEFDAVIVAVGAETARDLDVPGRDLDGIHLAMDYLVQQNRRVAGERIPDGTSAITAADKRVLIIGGGDTGADCYGNVIREGCASLQQLYIYPQPPDDRPAANPWPEWPLVLRTYPAHEEGGSRAFGIMVTGFSGAGAVDRVRAMRVEPRYESGSRRFEPLPGEEMTIDADLVLLAIGFTGAAPGGVVDDLAVARDRRTNVAVDTDLATNIPGVFAAGDAVRGASLIVWAIADGRIAARSCDRYLMGTTRLP